MDQTPAWCSVPCLPSGDCSGIVPPTNQILCCRANSAGNFASRHHPIVQPAPLCSFFVHADDGPVFSGSNTSSAPAATASPTKRCTVAMFSTTGEEVVWIAATIVMCFNVTSCYFLTCTAPVFSTAEKHFAMNISTGHARSKPPLYCRYHLPHLQKNRGKSRCRTVYFIQLRTITAVQHCNAACIFQQRR